MTPARTCQFSGTAGGLGTAPTEQRLRLCWLGAILEQPRWVFPFILSVSQPKGASMKVTFSHIQAEFRQPIENECARHVEKLNRWLKRYAPDSVQLHTGLEKLPRKTEYSFSLNLALPTGSLHATGSAADARTSAKAAFAELEKQLKKHQEKLRKDYIWKRKRGRGAVKPAEKLAGD